jgi:hypothetical protein
MEHTMAKKTQTTTITRWDGNESVEMVILTTDFEIFAAAGWQISEELSEVTETEGE